MLDVIEEDHTTDENDQVIFATNLSNFSLPSLPPKPRKEQFVYCMFGQNFKIDSTLFDSWMRILSKTREQNSVLWLLELPLDSVENLKFEARKRGINPDQRLIFTPR